MDLFIPYSFGALIMYYIIKPNVVYFKTFQLIKIVLWPLFLVPEIIKFYSEK